MGQRDFLDKPAPPNYVAGVARRAGGFITRPDVFLEPRSNRAEDSEDDQGLLGTTNYDAEDLEADMIYAQIDASMSERRSPKPGPPKVSIKDQFGDLKRMLGTVTAEEWEGIPEAGDARAKRVKKGRIPDRFTPVPDSAMAGACNQWSELEQAKKAKERQLEFRLDKIPGTSTGFQSVDPRGYLTGLQSVKDQAGEIRDIEKTAALLSSLVATHPETESGWISLARVQEKQDSAKARKTILEACAKCPKSEQVWIEAIRLHPHDRTVRKKALAMLPTAIELWLKSAEMETDVIDKRRVLQDAVEHVPTSIRVWKGLIETEDPKRAELSLERAVGHIPLCVEMWIALAKLKDYEGARLVLNRGRKACPTSHEIWIAAARLEETNGHSHRASKLIERAIQTLTSREVVLEREIWLSEAEHAEKAMCTETCRALVDHTIGLGVTDQKLTWLRDVDSMVQRGFGYTARCVLEHGVKMFPHDQEMWETLIRHAPTSVEVLERAVAAIPRCSQFWIGLAKERQRHGDLEGARNVLDRALEQVSDPEKVWIATMEMVLDQGDLEMCRKVLERARLREDSPRIWLKSALLERQWGRYSSCLELLETSISRFPHCDKFWMMIGQLYENPAQLDNLERARHYYSQGCKHNPSSVPLWQLLYRLEVKESRITKARAVLDAAMARNPNSPDLLLDSILLEKDHGNLAVAKTKARKALQQCPDSGLLLAEMISMEPAPLRKSMALEAIQIHPHDPHLALFASRVFLDEKDFEKTQFWLERAVSLDPQLGDGWAMYYRFLEKTGGQTRSLIERCQEAKPRYGARWILVSKNDSNSQMGCQEILKAVAENIR